MNVQVTDTILDISKYFEFPMSRSLWSVDDAKMVVGRLVRDAMGQRLNQVEFITD